MRLKNNWNQGEDSNGLHNSQDGASESIAVFSNRKDSDILSIDSFARTIGNNMGKNARNLESREVKSIPEGLEDAENEFLRTGKNLG